ncbi:MAG: hypothetical protein V8S42_05815 [Lachnospiraceae bacterium]
MISLQRNRRKKTPVIYGDYGIVAPELQKEENRIPADITEEERNCGYCDNAFAG